MPEGEKYYLDGSLDADLPKKVISQLFNVNYSLVSQANPMVIPFIGRSKRNQFSRKFIFWKIYEWIGKLIYSEIVHRVKQIVDLGI